MTTASRRPARSGELSPTPPPATERWAGLWLHVWGAWCLAYAPVLDVLRKHPEFLIANDLDRGKIVGLLLGMLVLIPAPWVTWAWAIRRSVRSRLPLLLLAPPSALIAVAVSKGVGFGWTAIAAGLAAAAIAVGLYSRFAAVRRFAGLVVPVGLVAPALLLADPAIRRLGPGARATGGGETEAEAPPIAMVVLDELPVTTLLDDDGRLDERRFPQLARLARKSHWFENVVSVDPETAQAVSALLAGRPTVEGELPIWRDLPDNLFTLLAKRYRISAIEPVTRLCPTELNRFATGRRPTGRLSAYVDVAVIALHVWSPRRFAELLPPIHTGWGGFTESDAARGAAGRRWWRRLVTPKPARGDRVQQFRELVAEIGEDDRGHLFFFHLLLPHRPWIYHPDGSVYRVDGRHEVRTSMNPRWPNQPSIAAQAFQRHLLQAEFTDRLVGELLDRLESIGLYEDSLVVVAADHGISFRPGDWMREPTATNREDLLQVPLLVKLPGQQEAVHHSEERSTLDVLPTLLDVAGVDVPPSLAGRSLASAPAVNGPALEWSGLAHRREVFGLLANPGDLYDYGPLGRWWGTNIRHIPVSTDPRLIVDLPRGDLLVRASAAEPPPSWIYGFVDGPGATEGAGVLVAIDGRVAATSELYAADGRLRFNALVPPPLLPPGEHDVTVAIVERATGEGRVAVSRRNDGSGPSER